MHRAAYHTRTLPTPEPPTQPEKAVGGNPTAAEKGLRDAEEESQHASRDQLTPVAPTPKVPNPTKGGERMLPMDHHTPNPLQQHRQNQEAEAKVMAAQIGQKTGAMKEKENNGHQRQLRHKQM